MADRKYYRGGVWSTQNTEQVFDGSAFQPGELNHYDGTEFISVGQAVQTVDNFEESPDGPYGTTESISAYYSGDTAVYQRRTTGAVEGAFNLENTDPTGFPKIVSTPGDGLPNYASKGDVFSCLVQSNSGGDGAVVFGATDLNNFYRADVRVGGGDIRIGKLDGGTFTALNSATVSLSANSWYDVEVEWHDGSGAEADNTLVLNIYAADNTDGSRGALIDSVSVVDSTFSTGEGVGFQAATENEVAYYDNFRITGSI